MLSQLKCEFVTLMNSYISYHIYGTKRCELPKELYALIKLLEWEGNCDDITIPCTYEKYL